MEEKNWLEEAFEPPLDNWDDLYNWVLKYGDKWDKFLMELTIPEF